MVGKKYIVMKENESNKSIPKELSELERIFFEHFTKRQDSNNDFLLRLLLIVGGVITGYGYLLLNLEIENYNPIVVLFMLIFAEILLLVYFKVIFDEGFAFRRDQLVAYRILKKYDLVAESEEQNNEKSKPFTYYYNPLKKFKYENGKLSTKQKTMVFWMPAFHNTLAAAIFLIHFLIYASFLIRILIYSSTIIRINHCVFTTIVILLFILTSIISLNIVIRKHNWLKRIYLQEFKSRSR